MEFIYAVRSCDELQQYQVFSDRIRQPLEDFLSFAEKIYAVSALPKAVVLTGEEVATKLISDIPLPGYTNEHRTVFCPDIPVWQAIYLRQLEGMENAEIRSYYEFALTERHILQILGHEFIHHSDLFIDEAYEKARWFEEGMCEYISRSYFLTEDDFREEARINQLLVRGFEAVQGTQSLEAFCADTYHEKYAHIFYFYWKSFLAVNALVNRFQGDVAAVFREYRRWFSESPSMPLSQWFGI